MNVANIMPGDTVEVELKYTELIVPEDKVYEFVYPTVVGPRYAGQASDEQNDSWVHNPYLHQGEAPTTAFDITVKLATGLPIQKASVDSHKVNIAYSDASTATIKLDPSERAGGNRDYILRYGLAGGKIASGLLLHEGEKENFFLLMMQPPKRVALDTIPSREYIFIVDISGSMHGYPLETSKKLLSDLIGNLRPTDSFNVLLFAGSSSMLAESSLPATRENINRALAVIDGQQGGGGTELLPALRKALSLPRREGFSRTVVIATDGYVSVEGEAFDLIRKNLGNANFFPFGIGTAVNRALIEGMARAGTGEPFVITRPEEAAYQAEKFRKTVQSPVLTQAHVDFSGFEAYDMEPVSVPDVLAERPVIIFGKWRGKATGTIKISGLTGAGPYSESIAVGDVKQRKNPALRYLWARHRIAALSDYDLLQGGDRRKDEVTDLSLRYNLLSAYTSFVAIDHRVRNKGGESATVKQPLPLPSGVSDLAVGGGIPACAPSPVSYGMTAKMSRGYGAEKAFETKGEQKARKDASPSIRILQISDPSRKDAIEAALYKKAAEAAACNGTGVSGEIQLEIKIGASGKVVSVKTVSNSIGDRRLEECLRAAAQKWQFGGSRGGRVLTMTVSVRL
jgi:Ca-activated chloride channel family protein